MSMCFIHHSKTLWINSRNLIRSTQHCKTILWARIRTWTCEIALSWHDPNIRRETVIPLICQSINKILICSHILSDVSSKKNLSSSVCSIRNHFLMVVNMSTQSERSLLKKQNSVDQVAIIQMHHIYIFNTVSVEHFLVQADIFNKVGTCPKKQKNIWYRFGIPLFVFLSFSTFSVNKNAFYHEDIHVFCTHKTWTACILTFVI